MHKLRRPQAPGWFQNACEMFCAIYPPADPQRTESRRWEEFKNTQQKAYKNLKKCLYENQYGLCAFCETTLTENDRQIEHFIPKSMTTNIQDYTICFDNYTISCKGNEKSNKSNHSCGHKKSNSNPQNKILNPYELPEFPIFKINITSEGLELIADEQVCSEAGINVEIAKTTLEYLGLNTPNLKQRRYKLWEEIQKEIKNIYHNYSHEEIQKELLFLASDHLEPHPNENNLLQLNFFYTTRLLCFVDEIPEAFLKNITTAVCH